MFYIIGGDLGGTYCRIIAYPTSKDGILEPLTKEPIVLRNRDFSSFEELLAEAERQLSTRGPGPPLSIKGARVFCLAAAGVYHPDSRTLTRPGAYWDGQANIGTAFDALGADFGKVHVRNDFEAQVAYVLSGLAEEDALQTVLDGEAPRGQYDIVLGPGTGLGVAAIGPEKLAMNPLERIIRTELGNSPLGYPLTSKLRALWGPIVHVLEAEYGITSPRWEDFLSGPGLERLHGCLHSKARGRISAEVICDEIKAGRFVQTREAFAELLALRCRDLCYGYWLPRRVLLTGGVLDKTPELVTQALCFEQVFRAFPVAEEVLGAVPVYLLRESNSGVIGAGWMGLQIAREVA